MAGKALPFLGRPLHIYPEPAAYPVVREKDPLAIDYYGWLYRHPCMVSAYVPQANSFTPKVVMVIFNLWKS